MSVVIPVRARRRQLATLLSSLAAQECDSGLFEVVVVDNPRRYNASWLQTTSWPFPLRYECNQLANRGLSRNIGARRATANLVLFVDSDMTFAPDAIRVMVRTVSTSPTSVVMANVVFPPGENRTLGSHLLDVPAYFRRFRREHRHGRLTFREFVSCSFIISRTVFDAIGGFDEGFLHYGYEDVEFALRAQEAGFSFELSTATAHHHKRLGPSAVFRQSIEAGRSAVHLVRQHPSIERALPVGVTDTQTGVLAYEADFDVGQHMARARSLERRWSRARHTTNCLDLRATLTEALRCYREIARFGRYIGIRDELATRRGTAE